MALGILAILLLPAFKTHYPHFLHNALLAECACAFICFNKSVVAIACFLIADKEVSNGLNGK